MKQIDGSEKMKTETTFHLDISEEGYVGVDRITIYLDENNEEITRKTERILLNIGDWETAKAILDEQRMAIVRATWTDDVILRAQKVEEQRIKEIKERENY